MIRVSPASPGKPTLKGLPSSPSSSPPTRRTSPPRTLLAPPTAALPSPSRPSTASSSLPLSLQSPSPCSLATACAVALLSIGALTFTPYAAKAAGAGGAIVGVPQVIDGDTMIVSGTKIRMYGIDAPESKQVCKTAKGSDYACGQQSAAALTQRVSSQPVRCEVKNTDQYGRTVGQCSVNGKDLGEFMVSNGYAVAYKQYSKEYVQDEEAAKSARKGIWSGSFTQPSEWRKLSKSVGVDQANAQIGATSVGKGNSAVTAGAASVIASAVVSQVVSAAPGAPSGAAQAPAVVAAVQQQPRGEGTSCNIKGNINQAKDRFYFVPGSRSYGATKIEEDKGERWFCSEEEAVAAGWTRKD